MAFSRSTHAALILLGSTALVGLFGGLALFSPAFDGSNPSGRPTVLVTLVLIAAGAVYLGVAWSLTRADAGGRGKLAGGILLGSIMRGGLTFSMPIQEDDYYRYLWNGAVGMQGHNPYRFSPAEVRAKCQWSIAGASADRKSSGPFAVPRALGTRFYRIFSCSHCTTASVRHAKVSR